MFVALERFLFFCAFCWQGLSQIKLAGLLDGELL